MKLYKSRAIVFRNIKYSESSIIVDLYTEEKGLRTFIVNGVRSRKGKSTSSYFQHFMLMDIIAYDKENDKISRLKEYKLNYHYKTIQQDVIKISVAFFLLEVTRNAVKEKSPHSELFRFIQEWFINLDHYSHSQLTNVPIVYMLELSHYLGFNPRENYVEGSRFNLLEGDFDMNSESVDYINQEQSKILNQLLSLKTESALTIPIGKKDRNELLDQLILYYRIHAVQFSELKSIEVLRTIF